MPGAAANTNSSVDNSLRHRGGYYIDGADLIIRVRGLAIEFPVFD